MNIGPHLPKLLVVSATGRVPTGGWTAIRLSEYVYVREPDDGILGFDMIGDPPFGPALEVVLPAAASSVILAPPWVRGVKVEAVENEVTALLQEGVPVLPDISAYRARAEQQPLAGR